jgi:hypothetical protein
VNDYNPLWHPLGDIPSFLIIPGFIAIVLVCSFGLIFEFGPKETRESKAVIIGGIISLGAFILALLALLTWNFPAIWGQFMVQGFGAPPIDHNSAPFVMLGLIAISFTVSYLISRFIVDPLTKVIVNIIKDVNQTKVK